MTRGRSLKQRGPRRGFLARLGGLFRTRQIYVRSEGDVQFITLSPLAQVAALIASLGVLFWTAFASVHFTFKDELQLLREQKLSEARLEFEERASKLRAEIDRMNDKLLLDQQAYLGRVDAVDAEQRRLAAQHEKLERFFNESFLGQSRGEATVPAPKPEKDSLNGASFQERYAQEFTGEDSAQKPLGEMQDRLAAFEDRQVALADAAIAHGKALIADASGIMRKLGIEPARAMANSTFQASGVGGPFIPVSAAEMARNRVDDRMAAAARTADEYDNIKQEILRLPVYLPMKKVDRVSSMFGFRRDPFRRSLAMHSGIDFKANYAAQVLAVSDGTVIHAGWSGGYGRLVEISHDNGTSTRYAHLSSISVSSGKKVKRGDIIGRMGSTGRSTGPHLHYETRVNGRAINPTRFWQALNDLQALRAKEN